VGLQQGLTSAADPERMLADLRALAEVTGNDRGAQRVAWTDTWAKAREWENGLLAELPVSVEVDEAGNQWATLEGESPETLIIGSHIDSVPDGGWLDGCLGVLSALEVLRGLARNGRPPLTVKLIDWADEEGARFGLSLLGSTMTTSGLEPDYVRGLRDVGGMTAGEALAAHGVEVERMAQARSRLDQAVAYIELHIEQGPVLEARDLPLGVVRGCYGTERWEVRFTGQAAHSGSTPMDQRRDSLLAAARVALEVRELARQLGGVGTTGRISSEPGIPTAVAGVSTLLVDQRHEDPEVLGQLHEQAEEASRRIAAEENVEVSWSPLFRIAPIPFDPPLIESAAAIVNDIQGTDVRLPSGPLHDAARVAEFGVPTVMLFVRSKRGLSHTKEEDTDEADLALALNALDRLVHDRLAQGTSS
jgi:hydantoinase/carbamoylase family amidase